MSRNRYYKSLEKSVNTFNILCGRGEIERAKSQIEQIYQIMDEVLDDAIKREQVKAERERKDVVQPETKPPTETTGGEKKTGASKKKPGRPKKVVSDE